MEKVTIAKWEETRTRENRFCTVEVCLEDAGRGPELSVCGQEGKIVIKKEAKREALAYWTGYFEQNRGNIAEMNERCGTQFRAPKSAAFYVLESDGEFHGLDVVKEDGDKIFIVRSCGQIRDFLKKWFPEYAEHFAHHLNGMHSTCEHQEARGETFNSLEQKFKVQYKGVLHKPKPSSDPRVCPNCKFFVGSAWLYRPLPEATLAWAKRTNRVA